MSPERLAPEVLAAEYAHARAARSSIDTPNAAPALDSATQGRLIEAHFGPLRSFVVAGSNHPNHTVATRALQAHLRWRNANAHHPDVLAAQRRERARVRGERHHIWEQRSAARAA